MNTTNTNNNPRIRPRIRVGESMNPIPVPNPNPNPRENAPFSEYVLFPPNTSSSSSSSSSNPFIFQSGIPQQNLAPGRGPGPDPSFSIFNFQFPLTKFSIEGELNRDTAFDLTIEESESHKKKKLQTKLAKAIETYLEEKPEETTYCLSRYTLFEIDGIQADVYIGKEADTYYYNFVAKNIEYVEDDESNNDHIDNDTDFLLIEKNDFDTVVDVLEHIEKVRDTYTFLDFYLLSPEKKETARYHRSFLPISQDKICSVCYEPTLEYSTCKHPICLKCREKCIVNERKMCPVCRSSQLRYYPTELAKL